jgi:RHS repeat-associated protein
MLALYSNCPKYKNDGRLSFSFCPSYCQLVRENNQALDKTFIYCYDNIGNITSVKTYAYTTAATPTGTYTEKSYTYDPANKDRLTGFNGNSITYNSLGRPQYYDNKTWTWTKGKLTRIHRGSSGQPGSLYADCKFTYDAYGRRLSKSYAYDPNTSLTSDYSYTYNTTYNYDNRGRLVREYCIEKYISGTTNTRDITYLYDEAGIIGAIQTFNSVTETFYFDRNIKGDVIALYNSSGTKVASYSYDSWGNCTVKTIVVNNFSSYNPIRYRGYYYDRETGLYYLNARYYNPEWRRFISPDDTSYLDPENVNGLNLYAYCYNDPVNYADPSGNDSKWWDCLLVAGIAIGAICLTIASCSAASAAIAPYALVYLGMSINTTLAITTAVVAATSVGIGAFAVADIQSIITDGEKNYLSFLGELYDPIKAGLYFTSYLLSYIGQFAEPGWGKQTSGTKDAPQTSSPYGAYTKTTPKGNDVTIYNGRGQAIVRYDFSHSHGGMIPHVHQFRWWIHKYKWYWDGKKGTVSPY